MEYNELIANRIKNLCKKRKLTPHKLATMSGVKKSTMNNIVRCVTKQPQLATIHKIAIGLSMTISEFLDYPEMDEYSFED